MTNEDNTDDRRDPADFTGQTKTDQQDGQTGTGAAEDQTDTVTETTTETTTETRTETATDELDGSELEPEQESDKGGIWDIRGRLSRVAGGGGNGNGDGGNGYEEGDGYDDNGVDDPAKRGALYAIGGAVAGALGVIGLDAVDGDWDGNYEIFAGLTPEEQPANETDQPTNETGQEPATEGDAEEELYFDGLNELPEGACYRPEGGVSGYFDAQEVEDALGQEAVSGLTPSQGDIAYDIDFRDANGDGDPDSYVVQLAGTDSQNDLTADQAETLFNELELGGSFC